MNNWFECKVKYLKTDEKGTTKSTTDTYLVDAISFSEAETRITEEVAPYVKGDFSIIGMKKAGINEIFPHEEGDRWYKCKVAFVSIDEVKGTEKKINSTILVFGADIDNAYKHLVEALSSSVTDYEVSAIAETNIVDIFPYGNSDQEMEMNSKTKKKTVVLKYDSNAELEDIMNTAGSSYAGDEDDEDDEMNDGEENDEEEDEESESDLTDSMLSAFGDIPDDPFADEAAKAAMEEMEREAKKNK